MVCYWGDCLLLNHGFDQYVDINLKALQLPKWSSAEHIRTLIMVALLMMTMEQQLIYSLSSGTYQATRCIWTTWSRYWMRIICAAPCCYYYNSRILIMTQSRYSSLQKYNNSNAPLQAAWSALKWTRAAEIVRHTATTWTGASNFQSISYFNDKYFCTVFVYTWKWLTDR